MKPRFCRYVAGEEQPYERMARIKKAIEDEQLGSVPPTDLTLDVLLPPFGENAFHTAARFCQLRFLPSHLLIFEYLSRPSPNGDSAYHLAARNGCLDQIPPEGDEVMHRLLLLRNSDGQSVLHSAFSVRLRSLDAIPAPYLTRAWLTLPDNTGSTPIHFAAGSGFLKLLLERNLVTLDDLFMKPNGGLSALREAALYDIDQLSPPPAEWGREYPKIRQHLEPVLFYFDYLQTQNENSKQWRKWLITLAQANIRHNR